MKSLFTRLKFPCPGTFAKPDFSAWNIESYQILWDKASLTIGLNELKGIQQISAFQWNGNPAPLRPGEKTAPGMYGPAACLFPDRDPDTISDPASIGFGDANRFHTVFTLHGSSEIRFAPASNTTTLAVTSPWPHPSFQGSYLPAERTITPEGFYGPMAGLRIWPGLSRTMEQRTKRCPGSPPPPCRRHVRGTIDTAGQFLHPVRKIREICTADYHPDFFMLFHV